MTKQQQVFLDIHGINRQTLSLLCKYGLLTKRQVKMAGYWPSSFFLRVYGPRWIGVEVYNLV